MKSASSRSAMPPRRTTSAIRALRRISRRRGARLGNGTAAALVDDARQQRRGRLLRALRLDADGRHAVVLGPSRRLARGERVLLPRALDIAELRAREEDERADQERARDEAQGPRAEGEDVGAERRPDDGP